MTPPRPLVPVIEQGLRLSPRRWRPAILSLHDVRSADWLHGLLARLKRRATFVSLPQFVTWHAQGSLGRHPGVLALTFDDGNKSIRTIVDPVCTTLGVPYTTFVCGDVLNGGPPPWFERVALLTRTLGGARVAAHFGLAEQAPEGGATLMAMLKTWPLPRLVRRIAELEDAGHVDPSPLLSRFMTAEDLLAVAANPLATVGSHTHRHPILANLGPDAQAEEIRLGLEALRRWVPEVRLFAYPNGKPADYDLNTIDHLRAQGILAAVTTVQRPVGASDDAMQLPRLGVSEGDSALRVQMKWGLPWPGRGDQREMRTRRQVAGLAGSHG